MHHRVFIHDAAAEVFKYGAHVRPVQQPRQIVHNPCNTRVDTRPRDLSKNHLQKGGGLGKHRRLAGEGPVLGSVTAPGRKQPVGRRLRLQVRKVGRREVLY